MPQAVGTTAVKRPANYSHCPLKKRPIKYDHVVEADYSSDCSDHNGRILLQHDSDSSEPENLSTKPEDLRLVNSDVKISLVSQSTPVILQKIKEKEVQVVAEGDATKLKISPHPIASTRTDKVNQPLQSQILNNSNSSGLRPAPQATTTFRNYLPSQSQFPQLSPSTSVIRHLPIPPPPPLKVFSGNPLVNGNGRPQPLEPISFNPQVATSSSASNVNSWSHYSPFNFMPPTSTSVIHGHHHHHNSRHPQAPSHHQAAFSPHYSPVSVPMPTKMSPPYALYQHQFMQHQNASHFAPHHHHHRSHLKPEIGSPPHVSPPLNNEPSYPARQEAAAHQHQQQRHYEEFTKFNLNPQAHLLHHKRETLLNIKRNVLVKEVKLNDNVNRSRSLSSGSSDRSSSSPIPDSSSSLSPCSTTGNGAISSTITPVNINGSIRYQCPDCAKSYSTFSGLSKHLQFHCASQNKKSFICKFCDKVYVSLGALKMHIRTHTLPCKCTICGKAFSRPWLLQGHIRTHTGEKPFTCEFCHRAFADRSNLRAHLQTHSEVKKYSCQSCSKTFSRTSLLAKHKDSGCGHGSA